MATSTSFSFRPLRVSPRKLQRMILIKENLRWYNWQEGALEEWRELLGDIMEEEREGIERVDLYYHKGLILKVYWEYSEKDSYFRVLHFPDPGDYAQRLLDQEMTRLQSQIAVLERRKELITV